MEFDEPGQRDPETHTVNNELKHVHQTKISKGWPLVGSNNQKRASISGTKIPVAA